MGLGKLASVLAACAILTVPALGATSLCVESGSTGFNWQRGAWVEASYTPEQLIVREVPLADELGLMCRVRFNRQNLVEGIVRTDYGASRNACYVMHVVGGEPSAADTYACVEYLGDGDAISSVSCQGNVFQSFNFQPSGEWVSTRTYAAPDGSATADQNRDSLVLSIGKCSVIAP